MVSSERGWEIARYIVSGLGATAVHFGVLTFNLKVLEIPSAGLANLVAVMFGIAASFLGSRYFVFRGHTEPLINQLVRFGLLYAVIAAAHATILYFWTDVFGHDYRLGFLLATAMQVSFSYVGNKKLVFAA